MKQDTPASIFSFYKTMLSYQKKYPWLISFLLISIAVSIAYECTVPLVFKWMFDTVLYSHNIDLLITATSLLGFSFILLVSTSLLQVHASALITAKVIARLRFKVFNAIQKIELFDQDNQLESDLITQFTNDLSFIESMSVYMMWNGINAMAMGVFGTLLLLYFDWMMTLIVVIIIPLSLILPHRFSNRGSKQLKIKKDLETQLLTQVQEAMTMQEVIRSLILNPHKRKTFKEKLIESTRASFKYSQLAGLTGRTSYLGLNFTRLLVLCGGGYFVVTGQLSPGKLIGFIMLLGSLNSSIGSLMSLYPILNRSAESLSKIQGLIGSKPQQPIALKKSITAFKQDISLRDVSFSYDKTPILTGVTVTVPKGKSVAFVGPSGAGKSTILKLILKEIEPRSGSIHIDGLDYTSISTHSLLTQIGFVMQQPKLFEVSIMDNIRMGKLEASEEEIIVAAQQAGIHDDIMNMPEQYHTLVKKRNVGLSGGQAQRIAIARALIAKPSILCLDEATSALDPFSGAAINDLLEELAGQHTIISITHRLSSAIKADQIVVLEKGGIVESGTHQELTHYNGLYKRLWDKQQGFIIDKSTQEISIIPEWLKQIPLFNSLEENILTKLAHQFELQRHEAEQIIVEQGEPGEKFYVVVAGTVEVLSNVGDKKENRRLLRDGDYFGEIALLFETPRNATVRAKTTTILLSMHYEKFHKIFNTLPPSLRSSLYTKAIERFSLSQQQSKPIPRFSNN